MASGVSLEGDKGWIQYVRATLEEQSDTLKKSIQRAIDNNKFYKPPARGKPASTHRHAYVKAKKADQIKAARLQILSIRHISRTPAPVRKPGDMDLRRVHSEVLATPSRARWKDSVHAVRALFPNIHMMVEVLRRTGRISSHCLFSLRSRVLDNGRGAKVLLGRDILFWGLHREHSEWQYVRSEEDVQSIAHWNQFVVSNKFNPDNIRSVLSFGTRFLPKTFHVPITDVRHETYYVEDYFINCEMAKENIRQLLSLTSGYPKEAFDCEIEAVPGKFPFPEVVFQIKKGSLYSAVPVELWFQKPFYQIHATLLREEAVFLHCAQGVSRSASMLIIWLMSTFDLSAEDAELFVRSKRSYINPNPLWRSLIGEIDSKLSASRRK